MDTIIQENARQTRTQGVFAKNTKDAAYDAALSSVAQFCSPIDIEPSNVYISGEEVIKQYSDIMRALYK